MIDTYKGRRIVIGTKKTQAGRKVTSTVNGQSASWDWYGPGAQKKLLDRVRREIDSVDERPIGNWPFHWYDPTLVERCPEGHAQPIGGPCSHPWCAQNVAFPEVKH